MIKNIAKVFLSHITVKGLGVINIILVLNFLSIYEFGEYSYLLLILSLIGVIIDPFLMAYFLDFKTFNYKKYNYGIIFLSIILSPIFYIIILQLETELTFKFFFFFYVTYMVGTGLKTFLNAKERYFQYGLVDVCRQLSILFTTLIFFYVFEYTNYIHLLELNYLVSALSMFLLLLFVVKRDEVYFNLQLPSLIKIIKDYKFIMLYTAIIPFILFVDSFFVERYLTEQDLGLYSFSLKIYSISLMLAAPIFVVLNIKQIEIAKEDNYYIFFKKYIKKISSFSIILFSICIVINYFITHYLYIDYRESFWDTTILLCASFIAYISMPFCFLIAYRRYKWLFILAVTAILVNILINYAFIAKYGTWIAALSTLLSQTIINLGSAIISYFILDKKNDV